jgi:hypothetical protein
MIAAMHTARLLLLCLIAPHCLHAQAPAPDAKPKPPPPKAYSDPSQTDDDFAIQGEYAGELGDNAAGIQVLALGGGKFEAVGYPGGLPGDGWNENRDKVKRVTAERSPGATTVTFVPESAEFTVEAGNQALLIFDGQGTKVAEIPRVERQSPTLGAEPPAGAVVLFDGKGVNRFPNSRVTEDGLLMEGEEV